MPQNTGLRVVDTDGNFVAGVQEIIVHGGTVSGHQPIATITIEASGGDVTGPSSATADHVATFSGTSGKIIKDGGTLPTGNVVGPGSASDGHLAVFDSTTGKLIKDGGAVPTGGITQLTGAVTAGPGSGSQVATIASVITAGGPTGSATVAPIITYNAAGQLVTVSSATITPAVGSITGLGTGVATALAVNVGSAGAPVLFNGAGGTPSSLTLTNASGLPVAGVVGTAVSLSGTGQVLTGGFHPTAFSNGTATSGTTTIDAGNGPIQTLTNGGAFTLAMSANDGNCVVRVTNNGSAGTITFSGFSEGSNTGDALDTTNGHIFDIVMTRIGGNPHYLISALQ